MSQTGKVGTFGGLKIPTVTIFMDGYAQGVAYYNEQKGKNVRCSAGTPPSRTGTFVQSDKPFEDVKGGGRAAQGLVSQGADIILPVAGPAGEGALQTAKASGGKVNAIWVDTDGCVSAPNYCANIVSSVYKGMDVAVFDAIKAAQDGSFSNEPFVGTLENEGTGSVAVQRVRRQGAGRAEDRARHDQGRHHLRQDHDRVQVAADLL